VHLLSPDEWRLGFLEVELVPRTVWMAFAWLQNGLRRFAASSFGEP
jgi:hypothetical protein